MSDQADNSNLQGFIANEQGISWEEWLKYAEGCPNLERFEPVQRPNPFHRGQMMTIHPHGFFVLANGQKVGSLCWEESSCLSVYGRHAELDAVVAQVCQVFKASLERVDAS